ncbi:Lovastatin diketide synthase LovF [Penicillium subrubescens]|uniref:Lovastatin diketide synthase LovF n=1 Tax=Penicillium subrubescens TaxID=1316194 RepID=A0A1Q5UAU6_9EURO|nr:Lovastatin diketide synthase LovF [Penicillium subrubescens]
MSEQGVLSPDAACKTFDARANGYARGEAINAVYIKRLCDAIRDGNPIQAVIRATASNCDGRTPGISHPSSESHEVLMRAAYTAAGLNDYSGMGFVECHGTGTSIGDPLEAQAVANVFGERGVYVGSCKPNVGHSEGASGITGVIKGVLALQHKTIPPNIYFRTPNPKILSRKKEELLVFSANHTDSLEQLVANSKEFLETNPDATADLAYTLGARREHLPFRKFLITGDRITEGPTGVKPSCEQTINFVFTGQGAQWVGMGRELLRAYPSVREDIRQLDSTLQRLPDGPSWLIEKELLTTEPSTDDENFANKMAMRFGKAEFAQPLCTAVQIVIINLLKAWGITPSAVVGHSSGEIAAAYAANAITQEEAIIAAFYRGLCVKLQTKRGGMAAVGLGQDDIKHFLIDGVVVACENSPSSVTISGDVEPVEKVLEQIKYELPGTFTRVLKVEVAYHSHHMAEVGREYQAAIEDLIDAKKPEIKFFSSVTGELVNANGSLGPAYWRANLESTVRFSRAVMTLLKGSSGDQIFLEIGPHAALQGPLRQILKSCDARTLNYYTALVRNTSATLSILQCVGQLYVRGLPIDFKSMAPGRVLTDLRPYPWHHELEYWDESRISKDWRFRKYCHHEILGSRISDGSDLEPTWRNLLRMEECSWIRDHQVSSDIIFPGAGYIAMAGEAIRQLTSAEDFTVREVTLASAMVISESQNTELITSLRPLRLTNSLDSVWYEFSITSYNGASWTKHCFGQVRPGPEYDLKPPGHQALPRNVSSAKWYQTMRSIGLKYGPRFQGLDEISTGTNQMVANASLSNELHADEGFYAMHPSTIDMCIQLFSAAATYGQPRRLRLLSVPSAIESLYIARPESRINITVEASTTPRGLITGNGAGTSNGKVVFEIKGLQLHPLEDSDDLRGSDPHAACHIYWKPDIDFLNPVDLIRPANAGSQRQWYLPVEKLALLCTIESYNELKSVQPSERHLIKYQSWLERESIRATRGDNVLVEEPQTLVALRSDERLAEITRLTEQVLQTPTRVAAIAIRRIFDAAKDIFEGKVNSLELLLTDDVLTQLYNLGDRWHHADFFKSHCHAKPWLRILEIGAGTGSTTATILDSLSSHGERMYGLYSYTDISAGFFIEANDRFANYSNIEYSVLDITQDPADQGFEVASYDVIIANNVLHATPNIRETLTNVKRLLRSDGFLFLDELCSTANWLNYIMGTLSGWWLGEADGRSWEPYVSPERWAQELAAVGFSEPSIFYDDEAPYQANALIVSRIKPVEETQTPNLISLLCDSSTQLPLVAEIENKLTRSGYMVEHSTLKDPPKPGQDIVSVLDLQEPFLERISEQRFNDLVQFFHALDAESGVLWLTRAVQVNCKDPRWAQSLGFTRTIRNELAVDVATLELDTLECEASGAVKNVLKKFQRRTKTDGYDTDYEWVLDSGKIHLGRFRWFSVNDGLRRTRSDSQLPKRLEITKRGFLGTLRWVQHPIQALVDDLVEVEVRAVGMNFKIYATVGTEEKTQYLVDTYGIPRSHIFNSRNATFLPNVLQATNGRGVDLVINSLSGELLHASWKCVAAYGSMVEIGKRDFIGRGRLNMDSFEANRAFFGVDFAQICAERPDIAQDILGECVQYYIAGSIRPITPVTYFPADRIQEAFRFMQKGSHIGKIVITMPEDSNSLSTLGRQENLALRPDASYLLVGGLGGLGRAVSTWLVENGANNLVYLSRSAGQSIQDRQFFLELQDQGCSVQAFSGDVSVLGDVERTIQGARFPVAGILQMSMVLKDKKLDQMCLSDWGAAIKPKVNGTWNLHEATKSSPLDFMVLFSSFSGIMGQRGQANYASANTFLDAFVQYRHANGLPASVLDIGPIEDVEESTDSGSADGGLRQFLADAAANPAILNEPNSAIFLTKELGKTLYGFLQISEEEIDISRSISIMGVDSLVAIELRNWCRHKMGVEITVLEILDLPNLEAFGRSVAQRLYSKYGGGEGHVQAACLTCRQKSRRCDRGRPMCKRCISKGLQCGEYPDKFRFCGIATRGKWKDRDAPIDVEGAPTFVSASASASPSSSNISKQIVFERSEVSKQANRHLSQTPVNGDV